MAKEPEELEVEVILSRGLGHPVFVAGAKERNDKRRAEQQEQEQKQKGKG